jgi:aminomethyltransferase
MGGDTMTATFDMAVLQRGARLRRSPFFAATQRYGAQAYTTYNHMLFPIRFADLEAEYWHLIEHVTVWDVAVERQVEITGRDAFTFVNQLTPRDLTRCAVGQGKYVLITAPDGGIINDPVLLRLGENHFWLALADSDVLLWAEGVALHAGLQVDIREPDVSPLQIQGPKAKAVVQALFGDAATRLPYYHFIETTLDGIPVVVT